MGQQYPTDRCGRLKQWQLGYITAPDDRMGQWVLEKIKAGPSSKKSALGYILNKMMRGQ